MPVSDRRLVNPSHGPIVPRIVNAILLRRDFYASVAADPHATGPAGAIVCMAALARESPVIYDFAQTYSLWGIAALGVVILAMAGWFVYGAMAYGLTRLIAPGRTTFKTVLRCLAYAETVSMLRLVALLADPLLYVPLHILLLIWSLLAVVVAMRAATGLAGARLWGLAVPCFVLQQAVLAAERMLAY